MRTNLQSLLNREIRRTHRNCEYNGTKECQGRYDVSSCPKIAQIMTDFQLTAFHNTLPANYGRRI